MAVGEMKQTMVHAQLEPWWIPHNNMLVDASTKSFGRSNLMRSIAIARMKSGILAPTAVKDEMGS